MDRESDPGWKYLRQDMSDRLVTMVKEFQGKKWIWAPDPEEGYIRAEVKGTKGDMTEAVTVKGNPFTVKTEDQQDINPPKFFCAEDMSSLSFLNDASVLDNLRQRYLTMMIYTFSGLFCVVINPYKRLPIYTDSVSSMFMGKRRNEVPPHLFSVSDEAYRNMLQDKVNQSMLITGESGAGKTENTKKVISYFAFVGASKMSEEEKPKPGEKRISLEDKIVRTNPVLEAYGNAKTVRNNNSSRFGKFIRIHFSRDGRVAGCDIEHYLLEKSRVIKQAPGERCYHIFYQIQSGAIPDMKERLDITMSPGDYDFINQAELKIDGIDDEEEMALTDESYDIMGFEYDQKNDMYKICSGMMHMGQMKWKQRPREEQAEADEENTKGEDKFCANQFGVKVEDFVKSICKPRVRVGTEWVNKGQNLEQVSWSIGALAKGVYARMFHWCIGRCNETLDSKALKRETFIGVLDIAGFEIFDFNSFEQLWINFVNEKLQQFFNHHMFVLEQEEYAREGIKWKFIDFGLDLAACIELIEKPMGVISMLDEECVVPKGSDQSYAGKMNDVYLGKHNNYLKPKPPKGKQAEAHFALGHYAGNVRYNVTAWLEKNKDPLNDTCVAVLKASPTHKLMQHCWADYTTQEEAAKKAKEGGGAKKKGKSAAFATVSMLYRESLNNLMSMLHTTHPHFIRCLIPNEIKKSGYLDATLVMNQLTCNGVLEGIRICRKGFPNRCTHLDYKLRYAILAADAAKSSDDATVCAQAMAPVIEAKKIVTEEDYRMGATKVFFKAGILAKLEDARDDALALLMTGLQAKCKWYLAIMEMEERKKQMAGFTILQKNIRSWIELRTWVWFSLYGKVKPLLKAGKEQEEMDAMQKEIDEMKEKLKKEETARAEQEALNAKLVEEKNKLVEEVSAAKADTSGLDEMAQKMGAAKKDLEKQLSDVQDRLSDQENKTADMQRQKKKCEQDIDGLKKNIQDAEMNLRKTESEKGSKEHQVKSLQDEMAQQDEVIAKLNKEKKHQEECSRKLQDDLQAEEDKVNHMNKVKGKLEGNMDELENSLEREKRQRQDVEKAKRKVEGELKVASESIEEQTKQKHDMENNMKRKGAELQATQAKLEDEQSLVAKLQRQVKELQGRCEELEEELEAERQARSKSERARSDAQRELEELSERLDEAGGATATQIELNKKREAELAKLRRDLEDANLNHESQLGALRKKHNDAVAEMGDQLDQLQKGKAKLEKDKSVTQRECEDLHNAVDQESKAKGEAEKRCKSLECQTNELSAKCDEQARQLADFAALKNRLNSESGDLARQLEDAEGQLNALNRLKSQLQSQLEEAKRSADEESRERQSLSGQLRNCEHELDTLREQLDEESEAKAEVQRQLSKANAEAQQWRAKYEGEGLVKAEELEDARRRLNNKLNDAIESLDQANNKCAATDKAKQRVMGELDDAQVECERARSYASALEKKQKSFDRVVDEWRKKTEDLSAELDSSQREARNLSTEVYKLKNSCDEMNEQVESFRRENKNLAQEIKDLSDQLSEGGRSVHELQKMVRRLEAEKDELQSALDEAEAALEAEESKVLRAQVEISQVRSEIEKRVQEKEEEFENTRKNHQRALDSMQATLETETKGRNELLRVKKKLEADINELEIALDHANKANAEAQKNLKRYQDQVRECQMQIEEEQRQRDEIREQYNSSETRCSILQSEKDDLHHSYEQSERARKQAEFDANESRENANELAAQASSLSVTKRKLEGELQAMHADLDESLNELRASEEQSKKASADAARLAEELRQEQEHAMHVERMRKGLEIQIKEMQGRLDEAEAAALKGGKRIIAKLETRIREIESELDAESRRATDLAKNAGKQDRRIKELEFQIDEDKKNQDRLADLVDKLQNKIKTYKRQVEEAEELANMNLQKYRQVQHTLEDAEERADVAENSLSKLRAKNRSSASVGPGLMSSASFAGF